MSSAICFTARRSWNGTGFVNATVDQLTDKIAVETDLGERDKMIAEIWSIVKDDIVYLPVHHQVIGWGMSTKLDLPIRPNDTPQFRRAKLQ